MLLCHEALKMFTHFSISIEIELEFWINCFFMPWHHEGDHNKKAAEIAKHMSKKKKKEFM